MYVAFYMGNKMVSFSTGFGAQWRYWGKCFIYYGFPIAWRIINQPDHPNILNFYQKLQLTTKSFRQDSELSASCSLMADCLHYQPLGSEADSVADSWTH